MDQNISPEVEGVNLTAASWIAVAVIAAGFVLLWSGLAAALAG